MSSEEIVNAVGEDIRDILQGFIGSKADSKNLHDLKSSIDGYLTLIKHKTMGVRIPDVKVKQDGPFITVNFQDKEGKRLDTLGEMLEYIDGIDKEV